MFCGTHCCEILLLRESVYFPCICQLPKRVVGTFAVFLSPFASFLAKIDLTDSSYSYVSLEAWRNWKGFIRKEKRNTVVTLFPSKKICIECFQSCKRLHIFVFFLSFQVCTSHFLSTGLLFDNLFVTTYAACSLSLSVFIDTSLEKILPRTWHHLPRKCNRKKLSAVISRVYGGWLHCCAPPRRGVHN